MSVDLTLAPFNLTNQQIEWVEATISKMTLEEKIGQLFFLMSSDGKEKTLDNISSIHPGGVMLRPMKAKDVIKSHNYLQSKAKIPLYLAANLETGGVGLAEEGTDVGHQMLIAATQDESIAYEQGVTCITEAKALGGNMAFAPIIDINFNWENPIANIRSYGDDVGTVSAMSQQYVNAVQDNGGFVTIKHFPGDGVDGRDQHVIKTINSLSYQNWQASFGKVYKDNIDNGATGLMVGHIALPSYFDHYGIQDEDRLVPASLSKYLMTDLLRDELGFNGLVMTDATLMTGFGAEGKRKDLLPRAIANGNDMILFTRNVQEDFQFMMQGYRDGIVTDDRLNQALQRIIGLKAKENLHLKNLQVNSGNTSELTNNRSKESAFNAADKGITLIQDTQSLLPLDVNKHKKIGIISLGNEKDFFEMMAESENIFTRTLLKLMVGKKSKAHEKFGNELTERGFEVKFIDHSRLKTMLSSVSQTIEEFTSQYDVIIYLIKKDTRSNQTNIRLEFKSFGGFDSPWFVNEIPTMMVSLGNPYHQYDLENVPTVINSYSATDEVIKLTVEKMLGRSEFKGQSPVKLDFSPFTGSIDKWN